MLGLLCFDLFFVGLVVHDDIVVDILLLILALARFLVLLGQLFYFLLRLECVSALHLLYSHLSPLVQLQQAQLLLLLLSFAFLLALSRSGTTLASCISVYLAVHWRHSLKNGVEEGEGLVSSGQLLLLSRITVGFHH